MLEWVRVRHPFWARAVASGVPHQLWQTRARGSLEELCTQLLRQLAASYPSDALSAAYQSGDFVYCGGSDRSLGNQDVIRQLAIETDRLGPFHEWSTCYNYRAWPEQRRKCPWEKLYLLHNDRIHWPAHLTLPGPAGSKSGLAVRTSWLEGMMRAGQCLQARAFPPLVLPKSVEAARVSSHETKW